MATTDVLTAAEARQALRVGVNDTTNTSLLTAAVSAVSVMLDDVCGPIVQRVIEVLRSVPTMGVNDCASNARQRLLQCSVIRV